MKATLGFSLLVKAVKKLIGKTLKVYVIVFSIMTNLIFLASMSKPPWHD